MLDGNWRAVVDRGLTPIGRSLRRTGITADVVTIIGIVMAAAALDRLGLEPDVVDLLDPDVLLPQVGQGALAIECRADDDAIREALAAIEHPTSRRRVDAERAFLDELGAGCDLPVAAHAVLDGGNREGRLVVTGAVSSMDGSVLLRDERRGIDGSELGRTVARYLLDERGGAALLER